MAISIKWNNHQSTFFKILKTQREKSKYTDATLAVDGKFYDVHKNIMSTSSEYFSDIFEKTSCKSPVIVLKDVPSNDMESLLDYMYLGEVDVNQNSISSFLDTAKCLKIKGLGVPDEYQTKLPKNSSNSCDDVRQNNRLRKRRRNDSSTIPTQFASAVPLLKKTNTDVTISKLTSSTPKKKSSDLLNTENSTTASVNSAQTPSIPTKSTADASNTSQDEPTEVKEDLGDANKDCEFEEITKTEHEVDIYDNTAFSEPSTSDIKEEEPLAVNIGLDGGKEQECYGAGSSAQPSIKPREDPSMGGSTKKMNEGIKVKEFSLLQQSSLLRRSGRNLNNKGAEDLAEEKNKENCTRAVRQNEIDISHDKMIQIECKLHKCSHCYKTFSTNKYLLQHMKIHTGMAKKEYKCIQCQQIFSTSKALKTHIITHTANKPYYCGDCDLLFSQKEDLLNHTKNHADEKSYQCNKCKESFSQNAILKVHMKTHIEKMPQIEGMIDDVDVQHQFTKCDKSFLHASILKTHMNTHAEEKPYNISDGNMIFKQNEELIQHNECNSENRPYKSRKCNKAFSQNQHLKLHMGTHTEEKKHQCNKCDKSFVHAATLKSHMSVHTFSWNSHTSYMKTHDLGRQKPYKCKYCIKTFSQKSYLSLHILKHTIFKCNICDKTFSLNSALRCHMSSVHMQI